MGAQRPLTHWYNSNGLCGCNPLKLEVFFCRFKEAVHCVALWTGTLSKAWTCVKYVPTQHKSICVSILANLHSVWQRWGMYRRKKTQITVLCILAHWQLKCARLPHLECPTRFCTAVYARPANYNYHQTPPKSTHEQWSKPLQHSIESWLANRDPYIVLL